MDARRPAHGYHGSREHGNERNAGGLYRSRLVRAGTGAGDAHLVRRSHALSGRRAPWRDARCGLRSLPASFVKNRKELITDHLRETAAAPRCTVALRWKHQRRNLLACKRRRALCCVHTLQVHEAGEGQSPDLTSSTHREVQLTRSAALARAAGKRLRRAADPTDLPGRAAAAAGAHVWHGRVRARNVWRGGRRERRERERDARAVRSRCAARASPARPRQLALEGDGPRRGVLSPPASLVASRRGAWQIVAGRVRPLEKQIRRTARAPGARCGASGARTTRRAADLCFRSARAALRRPRRPEGRARAASARRLGRGAARRRVRRRSGRREGAHRPVAAPGAARRRRGPEAFSSHLCFI